MAQPNINYLLGEEDGVFCGVVAVRNYSHLQHLYIVPTFQGRGVGGYLWETARDQAAIAGNDGHFTVNASLNAIPFYERMGFEPVGDVSLAGGLRFQPMKLIQARKMRNNVATTPTGIDWMLQQPLQTGGEAGLSRVSRLQERIKDD